MAQRRIHVTVSQLPSCVRLQGAPLGAQPALCFSLTHRRASALPPRSGCCEQRCSEHGCRLVFLNTSRILYLVCLLCNTHAGPQSVGAALWPSVLFVIRPLEDTQRCPDVGLRATLPTCRVSASRKGSNSPAGERLLTNQAPGLLLNTEFLLDMELLL